MRLIEIIMLGESLWTLSKKIERYGIRKNPKKSFGSFISNKKLFIND